MKLFGKDSKPQSGIEEMWKRKADHAVAEIKDMCRKISNGEVGIPSDDLFFILEAIRQDADFLSVYEERQK